MPLKFPSLTQFPQLLLNTESPQNVAGHVSFFPVFFFSFCVSQSRFFSVVSDESTMPLSSAGARPSASGSSSQQPRQATFATYDDYLTSQQWRIRRQALFDRRGRACEVCGKKKPIEVHHLTYARIFHEDDADLLVLCYYHHCAAEECVRKGLLTRTGPIQLLRSRTIELLSQYGKRTDGHTARNRTQEELLSESWFVEALKKPREVFKDIIRQELAGCKFANNLMGNAFAIYDRPQWIQKKKTRKEAKRERRALRKANRLKRALKHLARPRIIVLRNAKPNDDIPF